MIVFFANYRASENVTHVPKCFAYIQKEHTATHVESLTTLRNDDDDEKQKQKFFNYKLNAEYQTKTRSPDSLFCAGHDVVDAMTYRSCHAINIYVCVFQFEMPIEGT
jgi:hypothetical protein